MIQAAAVPWETIAIVLSVAVDPLQCNCSLLRTTASSVEAALSFTFFVSG